MRLCRLAVEELETSGGEKVLAVASDPCLVADGMVDGFAAPADGEPALTACEAGILSLADGMKLVIKCRRRSSLNRQWQVSL